MDPHELFVSQPNVFGGLQKPFEKADYIVLGVPFDATSTYRAGARFGPNAIRQASLNIETYSFRSDVDFEDLQLHDLGDLHVTSDTKKTLEILKLAVSNILELGKTTVTIGGEHTITLGVAKGLGKTASKTAFVSFDAHLDLRDRFSGLSLSHATFMRRIGEEVTPARIIEIGTRAVCKEELKYAKKNAVEFFTALKIKNTENTLFTDLLRTKLAEYEKLYLSIDMDVLDPAYVPAVQNPEPDGLEMNSLLRILKVICDKRVIGFDISEIAPHYDQGVSAIQAARLIFEILGFLEKH